MDWSITFLSPWWLVLLAVIPLAVWLSLGSLSGLGRFRRTIAIALRVSGLLLLIFALADLQLARTSDRLCTLFVLDESQSIPPELGAKCLEWISAAVGRRARDTDQAGLIVFGKNARIELPPAQYERQRQVRSIGSAIDRQYSDLAAGIQLALGAFPPDCAKRIVLISDGNQNRGNGIAQAVAAQQSGVPIDVVPIEYRYDSEVLVDKIVLPPDLKQGDTAALKIVIRSARPVTGVVRLNRIAQGESQTVLRQPVALQGRSPENPSGLTVLFLKQTIDEPDFYTYEAQFEPAPDTGDRLARNNEASAFTWIRGEGHVLLIENAQGASHRLLAEKLRQDNMSVTVRQVDQLRSDLAELRRYDTVLLANVPAEQLGIAMQETLAANTRELGAGLVMIGGPDSFGAGGYIGSPLEKALPVDMEVKATKLRGKGALVLIMHACEIPEGNYWQKQIAKLAINMLGARDECGLIYWGNRTSWLFALTAVGTRTRMHRRIDRMTPGDMPDFDPGLRMALAALKKSQAMTKHVIIISDGDPQPPSDALLKGYRAERITCTAVAVASHGPFEQRTMRRIQRLTGGRYYEVKNPKNLPQIYIKETRVVSRPLIFEREPAWSPLINYPTEPVAGLPRELPGIRGYVLTTAKPTADVAVISHRFPRRARRIPFLLIGSTDWAKPLPLPAMPARSGLPVGPRVICMPSSGHNWCAGQCGLPSRKTSRFRLRRRTAR